MRVGFIGLGVMGKPMAKNLVRGGHEVSVISRSQGPVQELVEAGATRASSISEMTAASEVVVTMLPGPVELRQVALGEGGIVANGWPGMVFVDMSTVDPDLVVEIGTRCRANDIHFLDAPVSGGESGAIDGTLSVMAGGSGEALELARPVFDAMASSVRLIGPVGAGQLTKAVNQTILVSSLVAISEGIVLLEKAGVDIDQAFAALMGGMANSRALERKGPQMINSDFRPGFRTELHLKDLGIALAAARRLGAIMPVSALATQLMTAVEARGDAKLDHSAVVEVIRGLSSHG